jgi:hypothetical protein
MSEDESEEPENFEPHDKLIRVDVSEMFSLELLGRPDLYDFVRSYAPIFENLRQMTLGSIGFGINASQAARLIDDFAPRLETLSFKDQNSLVKEVYAEMVELRSTQGVFGTVVAQESEN